MQCDYTVGLLPTDHVTVMSAVTEFFATRLVRKESRSARPLEDPSSDLYRCIDAFRAVVRYAHALTAAGETVNTDEWEERCSAFTEEWKELCHWCCPVRLGEFLGKHFKIRWSGEEKERKKPPTRSKDRKEAAGKQPAQPYWCAHCSVLCNSLPQTIVHMQGQRHRDQVTLRAAQCAAMGIPFQNQPPQPICAQASPQASPIPPRSCVPQAEVITMPQNRICQEAPPLPMAVPLTRGWSMPQATSGLSWEEGSNGLSDNVSDESAGEGADDGPPPLLQE